MQISILEYTKGYFGEQDNGREMMEAKDTVMSEKEWLKLWYSGDDKKHLKVYDDYLSGLINQAEISFEAGMKKVMEWITSEFSIDYDCGHFLIFDIDEDKWQAQLKEWGIEEVKEQKK